MINVCAISSVLFYLLYKTLAWREKMIKNKNKATTRNHDLSYLHINFEFFK
jgi:hypothetical protein